MIEPTQQMRQVLAELEILAHGSITAYNPSGGQSGEPDDRFVALVAMQPRSLTHPDQAPHLRYRALWGLAHSDEARSAVLHAARKELAATRGGSDRVGAPVTSLDDRAVLERNILERGKGWKVSDVAQSLNTSPTIIRKTRLRSGVDPETGRPRLVNAGERSDFVAELTRRGYGQGEIAKLLEISQPTVSRLLRTRRKEAA